ncbi:MAG: sulfatase [Planctomycetota bacterium]
MLYLLKVDRWPTRLVGAIVVLSFVTAAFNAATTDAGDRPNVLIITVDDMSADSIGAFGSRLPGTTPTIDEFAKSAMRFNHAHVQVGNCMPGRNIMWSGLFSHVNGVEGFQRNLQPNYPVLCDLAKSAGYFTAIRGKSTHSTPYFPYGWDADVTEKPDGSKYHLKDPESYGESTRRAIEMAGKANKPFCLMVNISDPHKPFYSQTKGNTTDPFVPSRVFTAQEVPVPGFLPSDDIIKQELALYYSSVRRADDCFRSVMHQLDASGKADETFVMFLSDHGMPLPFAKTQLYHHSTHTPLMIRWPGVTKDGSQDDQHMVSAIDFLPTLVDVMQLKHPTPERLHGRSFASLLEGQAQDHRDYVILQYNENSGRWRHPMRGIQTTEYLYLYNPWSDGNRKFATATTGTATYRRMVARAKNEPEIADRLELFDHRVLEELYDVANDPDCLHNLIDDPQHEDALKAIRSQLVAELQRTEDPVAPVLAAHPDADVRNAYMAIEDAKRKPKPKKPQQKSTAAVRKTGLIKFDSMTATIQWGELCEVRLVHKLPKDLGSQSLHVTLKQCTVDSVKNAKRLDRQVVQIQGEGERLIRFRLPEPAPGGSKQAICISAFVGPDYSTNFQHITTKPQAVKPRG